jgi:hypothetical protein
MWVQDVPVRVERVPCIPHGAKVLVDKPSNGQCVIWVRDDLDDRTAAELIARGLSSDVFPVPGLLHLSLHAS